MLALALQDPIGAEVLKNLRTAELAIPCGSGASTALAVHLVQQYNAHKRRVTN